MFAYNVVSRSSLKGRNNYGFVDDKEAGKPNLVVAATDARGSGSVRTYVDTSVTDTVEGPTSAPLADKEASIQHTTPYVPAQDLHNNTYNKKGQTCSMNGGSDFYVTENGITLISKVNYAVPFMTGEGDGGRLNLACQGDLSPRGIVVNWVDC